MFDIYGRLFLNNSINSPVLVLPMLPTPDLVLNDFANFNRNAMENAKATFTRTKQGIDSLVSVGAQRFGMTNAIERIKAPIAAFIPSPRSLGFGGRLGGNRIDPIAAAAPLARQRLEAMQRAGSSTIAGDRIGGRVARGHVALGPGITDDDNAGLRIGVKGLVR